MENGLSVKSVLEEKSKGFDTEKTDTNWQK